MEKSTVEESSHVYLLSVYYVFKKGLNGNGKITYFQQGLPYTMTFFECVECFRREGGGGVTRIFKTCFGLGIWDVSSLANILGPSL